jgi:hypothetical protein
MAVVHEDWQRRRKGRLRREKDIRGRIIISKDLQIRFLTSDSNLSKEG